MTVLYKNYLNISAEYSSNFMEIFLLEIAKGNTLHDSSLPLSISRQSITKKQIHCVAKITTGYRSHETGKNKYEVSLSL